MLSPSASARTATTQVPYTIWAWLFAGVAFLAFAAPLFVGLDRWDMRNDEAIYSYAVERILETGEWLTPRSIPTDVPFLEKPPLKFWTVAGAMTLGLTPNDELGMRVFDAIFGAAAFAYVMAFAWRAAGPVAGAVALLVLFSFGPLLFDHGLRSNNMEAALVLSYCGGLYHFLRWNESDQGRTRQWHALAVALFTVLGFMTKFVAVAFLPMVAAAFVFLRRETSVRAVRLWRDWVGPLVLALALVLPWFIYESRTFPGEFWSIILGEHVVKRFSSSLDPSHLAPWHYYFTFMWREFSLGGSAPIVAAGVVVTTWKAVRGVPLAQLLLIWWALPLSLMSTGTSKVGHYAFPYLPPLAIGAGWAVVEVYRVVSGRVGPIAQRVRGWTAVTARPAVSLVAASLAVLLTLLALWTLLTGTPASIAIGNAQLLSNSSVVRPALAALLLFLAAGRLTLLVDVAIVAGLLVVVPLDTYARHVERTSTIDRPLGAAADCMRREQAAGRVAADGVYLSDPRLTAHPAYYYFRHVGPWRHGPEDWRGAALRRMLDSKSPVLVSQAQWRVLQSDLRAAVPSTTPTLSTVLRVVGVEEDLLLVLPAGFAACEVPVIEAGGRPLSADAGLP